MLVVDKMLVISVRLLKAKKEGAWNFAAVMFKKEAAWQYQKMGEAARGTDDTQTQSSIKGNQQSEENE